MPTSRKRNVAQKAKTSCVPSTSKENTDSVRNDNAEEKEKAKGSVSGPSVSLMDVSENGGNETDDDEADRETGRDSDTEDMDDTGEDGDRLSVVSESLSSSSLYRSRIPIPIAGSFGKHLVSFFLILSVVKIKNSEIILSVLMENICCDPSLELP